MKVKFRKGQELAELSNHKARNLGEGEMQYAQGQLGSEERKARNGEGGGRHTNDSYIMKHAIIIMIITIITVMIVIIIIIIVIVVIIIIILIIILILVVVVVVVHVVRVRAISIVLSAKYKSVMVVQ